jgi:protein subunit release factor A
VICAQLRHRGATHQRHHPVGFVAQDRQCPRRARLASGRNAIQGRTTKQHAVGTERERLDKVRAADRKDQVGSGDRSERIRTYNFPQGRCTDHRINLTLYELDQVMQGMSLGKIIDALVNDDQAKKLAQLDESAAA